MIRTVVAATILLLLALGTPPPAHANLVQAPSSASNDNEIKSRLPVRKRHSSVKTHADWHPQVRGKILARALKAGAKTRRLKETRLRVFAPTKPSTPVSDELL
ncbi:MAG: hypothetical protein VKN33_07515 [Candidatus Sericytochromatia bacterium]|nr:hypothetical protein [Candidatus Sericytochromatia bacterium]